MVAANLKELRDALKIAGKVVDRKNSMPVLRTVLLQTEDNGPWREMSLSITATDLENYLVYRIPLAGRTRIPPVCVDHAALVRACQGAGKCETIEFDFADGVLAAVIGRGRYPLDTSISRDDFPMIPRTDKMDTIGAGLCPEAEFKRGLDLVKDAVSRDEMRRALNGVFFDVTRGKLAGTDGHRLHVAEMPFQGLGEDSLLNQKALPCSGTSWRARRDRY